MKKIGQGIADGAERTGNLFTYGEFGTDDSPEVKYAKAKQYVEEMQTQGYVWSGSGEKLSGDGSMTDIGIPGFVQNTGNYGYKMGDVDRGEGGFLNELNTDGKFKSNKDESTQSEANTNGKDENKNPLGVKDSIADLGKGYGKLGDRFMDTAIGKFVDEWIVDPIVSSANSFGSFAKEWIIDSDRKNQFRGRIRSTRIKKW